MSSSPAQEDKADMVFQGEITPLKENMNNVNGLAHQFTSSEIPLSPYMLNRLEDLNGRWKLLQPSSVKAGRETQQQRLLLCQFVSQ
ncbi:hypothetical protein L345_15194, partial [Ophiophagus hannah]